MRNAVQWPIISNQFNHYEGQGRAAAANRAFPHHTTYRGEKRKWPHEPKRSEHASRKKKRPNLLTVTTPIQISVCQYLWLCGVAW
jgi:hypothetical protein